MKNLKNDGISPIVSRETFCTLLGFVLLALFPVFLSGCGEDTISEDISGFNKVLSTRYDIKAPEDLAKFYHDYLYDNPGAKLTYEMSPQTHSRVKIVMINQKPVDNNMLAEKIEIVAKYDETKWKVVVINRNWKCKSKGESGEWGIEPCK
ncbi:MAG TPA: hypothetical protein VG961_10770 [Ignavibacteria bacterium]|nr:hypothetical protein [Ignavibacteria bacterium]